MASFLRHDPDEERVLYAVAWPGFIQFAVPIVGLAGIALALWFALRAPEPGHHASPLAIVLLLVASVPSLAWLLFPVEWGPPTSPRAQWLSRYCEVERTLVPLAVLYVLGLVAGVTLGSQTAYDILSVPVLACMVVCIVSRPRRRAVVVAVGADVVLLLAVANAALLTEHSDVLQGVLICQAAFALAVSLAYSVRLAVTATQRVGEAQAREVAVAARRDVARDVHDVVAHTLAVTMLHVTAARMAIVRGADDDALAALEEAERQGRASLADVRRVVRLLRADGGTGEPDAPQPDLAGVDDLVAGYRAAGLDVEWTMTGDADSVEPSAALALYRALQEALANASRHGDGPVVADLRIDDGRVTLRVDNPLAAGPPPGPARGSGLLGMRERIAAAGGTLEAGPCGRRWAVLAEVPMAGSAAP